MRKSAGSRYVEANITIFETRFARSVGTLAKPVLLGWIVLSILWTSNPVAAQISPGSLSRAHQSINGMTECTTCHELSTGKPTFKCLDCHSEIARRIAARRGLHAAFNIKPGSSLECTKCHSEHNGEDFPLVKWDLKTFDHAQTGYGLEGKHSGLECNRCHTPERVSPRERAVIKVKDLSRTFLGLSPSCSNCHQDEHKGQLGPNCLQCHNYSDWKSDQLQHVRPFGYTLSADRSAYPGRVPAVPHARAGQTTAVHRNCIRQLHGLPCRSSPWWFFPNLPVLSQHRRMEEDLGTCAESHVRPFPDEISPSWPTR